MATLGGYETQHELYRHALGWLATAVRAGAPKGQSPFVAKVFQPAFELGGPEAMDRAVRMFLERARLQQDLVAAGAKRWAPVYEFGPARQGAYYISQYFPRSAQKLIVGRVKMTSAGLHAVVSGALDGLLELKRQTGRTHGELKPSNIFFTGPPEVENAAVMLADPGASETMTAAKREAADVRALGELIYQLVLHRPFRSSNWPVAPSAEWSRLGRQGDGWRELCSRLLDPSPAEPTRLDSLKPDLHRLRQRRRIVNIPLVAGVLILLIGLGAAYTYYRFSQFHDEWRDYCRAYDQWLYGFALDVSSDPQRAARLEAIEDLNDPVQRIAAGKVELDPKKIADNPLLTISALAEQPPMRLLAIRQTDKAVGIVDDVHDALVPDRWPLLKQLVDRQKEYEQRQWAPAAAALKGLTDAVTPPFKSDLAQSIDRLLKGQGQLEQDLAAIEQAWGQVTAARQLIEQQAGGDPLLKQFPAFVQQYLQQSLARAPTGIEMIAALRGALGPLADLSNQLATVVRADWAAKIDRPRFARDGQAYKIDGTPQARDYQAWLTEVKDFYTFTLQVTDEPLAGLLKGVAGARAEIDQIKALDKTDAPAKLGQRLAQVQAKIDELRNHAWVERDRKAGALASAVAPVRTELQTLAGDVESRLGALNTDQKDWWAKFAAKPASDSAVITEAWGKWRQEIVKPHELPLDFEEFKRRRELAELWRGRLTEIDKQVPEAPALDDPYAALAKAKREQVLRDLLTAHPWDGGSLNPAKLKDAAYQAGQAYAAWVADLRAIAQELPRAREQLDALLGLHEEGSVLGTFKSRWQEKGVWKDLSDQPLLKDVVSRIDSLEKVDAMARADLAQLAGNKESAPLLVLAAWRRLSALTDWPGKPEEVAAEALVHANAGKVVEQIKDPFRKKLAAEQWQTGALARLSRYLNRADGDAPAMQAAAKAAADALPVLGKPAGNSPLGTYATLAQLDGLDARAQYNVLLAGVRTLSAAEKDDARLTALVTEFRQQVAKLPPEVKDQPPVVKLLGRLGNPAGAAGPTAPWAVEKVSDDQWVYTMTDPALGVLRLDFRRVETAPGHRPAFLCTTEVSVGQFAQGVGAQAWKQIAPLLYPYNPAQGDPRLGPLTWQWIGKPGQIAATTLWLRDPGPGPGKPADYPANLKDPDHKRKLKDHPPGPGMPMQYLSVPAARQWAKLMGCRLPTVAEWQAAYQQSERNTPPAQWNLRDQTFLMQKQYIQTLGTDPRWPDADIFWPAGLTDRKQKKDAIAYTTNDGFLWFKEVAADGGQKFKQLVGNVAEYVAEDEEGTQVRVIGASALSSPDLERDKPYVPDETDAKLGYSDVGLRLAFDAPPASLAQSLQWTIHETWVTYLRPPPASTQPTAGK